MNETIGYVGLGAMGRRMLKRLASAFGSEAVLGFDANPAVTADACREAGAQACQSIGDIAGRSDILFTCVPNNDVVRAVYLGDDGIASAIKAGSVTIDCSTVGPDVTREVCHQLKAQGVSHLDASMLGSTKQAAEGTISFVVGGDPDALERVQPALQTLGGMIRHCGGSGMGNTMKLLHQTLVASHSVATGETLAIGEALGVDLDLFYDIVTQGTGLAHSRFFEQRTAKIRSGDFSPMFMLKFMAKDTRLARDMISTDSTQSKLTGLNATIDSLETAEEMGLGDEDFSAVFKVPRSRLTD